jgi:micrococcal nuclease
MVAKKKLRVKILWPWNALMLLILVALSLAGSFWQAQKGLEYGFKVTRVIDGDTVEIETGETVRYIGIDTPETKHPDKGVECFGREAAEKNQELAEGRRVTLEKDVSERDRYGRLLRYVYADGLFINEVLVREGYARTASFPPDVKYQELFRRAEQEAREAGRGLWGAACADN